MSGQPQPAPRRSRARLGLWLAGIYFVLAAGLFILTLLTTKPGNVGLDWIPFLYLTMPWSGMDQRLAVPGVLFDTAALWLLGTLIEKIFRR